jgi:hypothetical protein
MEGNEVLDLTVSGLSSTERIARRTFAYDADGFEGVVLEDFRAEFILGDFPLGLSYSGKGSRKSREILPGSTRPPARWLGRPVHPAQHNVGLNT